jgi:hypothetical protein
MALKSKRRYYSLKPPRSDQTRKNRGGKAISAGTYGCVFKNPPLQCASKASVSSSSSSSVIKRTPPKSVSKLMLTKHVVSEMQSIRSVQDIINDIPHKERYFLVAKATSCTPPAPLKAATSLPGFDTVCKNLVKKGITAANVNKNLDSLGLINMPDGGVDLDQVWQQIFSGTEIRSREQYFTQFNNHLIELLLKAIGPLNQRGMLHNDLKDKNVLVNLKTLRPRIIDWGLAGTFDPHRIKAVPSTLYDRSLNFNRPVGGILFRTSTSKGHKPVQASRDPKQAAALAAQILQSVLAEKPGHYSLISQRLLPTIYKNAMIKQSNQILVENLAFVLQTFVKGGGKSNSNSSNSRLRRNKGVATRSSTIGTFDGLKYFKQVYQHNADVVGFLMCYKELLTLPSVSDQLLQGVQQVYKTYVFGLDYATRAIPLLTLAADLRHLNSLL